MKYQIITSVGLLALVLTASASLTPTAPRGKEIIQKAAPGGASEICVIPKHFPGGAYNEKFASGAKVGKDEARERELCDIDFYNGKNAVCPKISSTNPGVELYEGEDGKPINKAAWESKNCTQLSGNRTEADKVAKYKQSTSCSYTGSILGYYHLSRILGDIGNVPNSVLRSMLKTTHLEIAKQGVDTATKLTAKDPGYDLLRQTWGGLYSGLTAPKGNAAFDRLQSDDGKFSFGGLIANPKKEFFYNEMFESGPDRAQAFKNSPFYRMLGENRPVADFISTALAQSEEEAKCLVGQKDNRKLRCRTGKNLSLVDLLGMKDASEFILMDTIMNQADRFGNIHAILKIVTVETEADGKKDLVSEKFKLDNPEHINLLKSKQAILVKEMLLKDNDCGVTKEPKVKNAGLLNGVNHMSRETYRRLIWLDKVIDGPAQKEFFQRELMMTPTDLVSIRKNLSEAVQLLQKKCLAGGLYLDLNPNEHMFRKYNHSETKAFCTYDAKRDDFSMKK